MLNTRWARQLRGLAEGQCPVAPEIYKYLQAKAAEAEEELTVQEADQVSAWLQECGKRLHTFSGKQ